MAVISASDYVSIATDIANGYDDQVGAKQDYFNAVYKIALLDEIKPSVDLLQVFYNTYLVATSTLQSTSNILSAVRAANNHVIVQADVADMDEYLSNNGVTVPQTWADLSAQAGFTISAGNIS